MKSIKIANNIALGIPVFILLLGFADHGFFLLSIVSLTLTGIIQTIIALVFWRRNKENLFIKLYFVISIIFFLFTFVLYEFDLDDVFKWKFWFFPILSCLLLSYIIYTSNEVPSENQ
ncbi:hypothetical protein OX283_007645 [Flavobacterium sp. SUN052]|uniref:hypothetical protein n=1 Tax=Flavobacterium sp. SUN052 TaxID=3002441 RepID=UPI00237D9723|nr:hypothetical protein [Flavobacterium sp. SUN052]MEC4004526.1 hypothetical protein [Flavobacterium sp. SUN052]